MKYLSIILLLVGLCFVSTFAQNWSAEEKEVWQVLEDQISTGVKGDLETMWEKYIHPDCSLWSSEIAVPIDLQSAKKLDTARFQLGMKYHAFTLTPLTIKVYDDFAILNFYVFGYHSEPGSDEIKRHSVRLHNTWKKENGRWLLLATHNFFD